MTTPRSSAAFLDLTTSGGVTVRRWQSGWIDQSVSWEGASWQFREFEWRGITSGGISSSSPATIAFIHLPSIAADLREADQGMWLGRLRVYHRAEDILLPSADQVLVGVFIGQIVIQNITQDQIEISLDNGQAAIGGQFPPTIATTAIIGIPCQLEV